MCLFGRIQDYFLDYRFVGFITIKETKIRKWILHCDSNSEFRQQDGRKKRTAKRFCATNVTGLLLASFVVTFT